MMFNEIAASPEDVAYLRQARHNVDAAVAALDEPKGLVATLKEDTKKHGYHRNAFDAARRAANRKLPEAQSWFRTVAKCAIAWGVFDQRDIEDVVAEATALAARNGEEPPEPTLAEAMQTAIEKDGGEKPTRAEVAAAAGKKATGEKAKRNGNGTKPHLKPREQRPKIPVRGRKGDSANA